MLPAQTAKVNKDDEKVDKPQNIFLKYKTCFLGEKILKKFPSTSFNHIIISWIIFVCLSLWCFKLDTKDHAQQGKAWLTNDPFFTTLVMLF